MPNGRFDELSSVDRLVMQVAGLPPPALGSLTIGILLTTFLVDCFTPLGIAAWAPYPLAIVTAFWWKGGKAVVSVTMAAVGLTIVGKLFSPPGVELFGVINRVLGISLMTLVGMLCVRLDKREQAVKTAVRHLEVEEAKLREVVSNSHHLMALVTPEGAIIAMSESMKEVSGGVTHLLAAHCCAPALEPHWPRVIQGEPVAGSNLALPGHEGRVWDWNLTPIRDEEGGVLHVLFEAQDVTVRAHEAETRLTIYRGLFSVMSEGVILTDTDHRILEWNPAMERLFGWSRTEVIGQNPRILKSGHHPAAFYERMNRMIAQGETFVGEVVNRRKDGTLVTVLESIVPILGADKRPQYFLAVLVDLTERKLTEQKLLHVQKLEGLGVMAAGIAHDFNNLLAGVLGYAGLVQDSVGPGHPAQPMLAQVVKAAQKASVLTNQMLAYAGKGRFHTEVIALERLVEDMVNLLRPSLSKKIELVRRYGASLPTVKVDPAQIQQVIMNLCLNAGEAIGDQVGTITITVGEQQIREEHLRNAFTGEAVRHGRYVVLEVADTGCGMDEEMQKKIFDPFFSTKASGRGLGLSAVYGIVTGHGGAIKVYSHVGSGTTFKVLLPASDQAAPVQTPIGVPEAARGRECILVIDDEEMVRNMAVAILSQAGYQTIPAKDGREGLAIYRSRKDEIHLVLVDMMMPAMSGAEVFAELRAMNPSVKVILSSGFNEVESTRTLVSKGLAGFIQKPYTPKELTAKVRSVLDARV
jgi:PAS domain S-box-containing protein